MFNASHPLLLVLLLPLLVSCAPGEKSASGEWVSLFNGRDLDGWVAKIAGHPLGENFGDTFGVEDGLLKVSYDRYGPFGRQFGSLTYREPFSHYRIRVEYRFVGEQAAGGPSWGFRDSGIQFHGQPPETMLEDQEFPVCVEVNLIGNGDSGDRPTGDVCTPGTHVVIDGELFTPQCASTSTAAVPGDAWVTVEAEVRGNASIIHRVNGEVVAEYAQPQLDESSPDARRLLEAGYDRMVSSGYISLQSNSHPIEFRKIEVLKLE
jgi:hypothetical protein